MEYNEMKWNAMVDITINSAFLPNEIKSKIIMYTTFEICVELGYYFEAKQLYLYKINNIGQYYSSLNYKYYNIEAKHRSYVNACIKGNLKVLKFIYYFKLDKYDNYSLYDVAKNGHLECLKWLIKIGNNKGSKLIIDIAIEYGHIEIVKYLHSIGIKCDTYSLNRLF